MKRLLLALPLAIAIGCAGCSATMMTTTEGTKIEQDSAHRIEPGKTTKQMVLDSFGEPTETSTEDGMEKMTYVFKKKEVPSYLGGFIQNEANAKVETTTLEVTIGDDGVVRSYRFKSSQE